MRKRKHHMKSYASSGTAGMLILAFLLLFGYSALAENKGTIDIRALQAALENDGFIVQEGKLGYIDLIKLYNSGLTADCTANNPSSPYLTYFLQPVPGQALNNLLTDAPFTIAQSTSAPRPVSQHSPKQRGFLPESIIPLILI